MTNDFLAKNGIEETSPYPFGDSWRVRGDCIKTKEPTHPCKENKHREPKAHAACAIIKSIVFRTCHTHVDPDPYYDRCVYDTCGCDMVGDCECTCEAIAAYAYECLRSGVVISWRKDKCGKNDQTVHRPPSAILIFFENAYFFYWKTEVFLS